jgi:hypothetical protein
MIPLVGAYHIFLRDGEMIHYKAIQPLLSLAEAFSFSHGRHLT